MVEIIKSEVILMGRYGFLKKIKKDLPVFKEKIKEASSKHSIGNIRIKEVHEFTDSDIKKMDYNLKHLFKKIFNDKKIPYCAYKFIVDMEKNGNRTNILRNVAIDLDKMEQLPEVNRVKKTTFIFIILHFYLSHFDFTINFLKPIAKAIQKLHNYKVNNNRLNMRESWQVLEVFRRFRPTFYWYLVRFLDKDLRNAIAHDNYEIGSKNIYYKKKPFINGKVRPKNGFINHRKLYAKHLFFGKFINQLQAQHYEIHIMFSEAALKNKMTKRQIKKYLHNLTL